jgi:hypothetical protein
VKTAASIAAKESPHRGLVADVDPHADWPFCATRPSECRNLRTALRRIRRDRSIFSSHSSWPGQPSRGSACAVSRRDSDVHYHWSLFQTQPPPSSRNRQLSRSSSRGGGPFDRQVTWRGPASSVSPYTFVAGVGSPRRCPLGLLPVRLAGASACPLACWRRLQTGQAPRRRPVPGHPQAGRADGEPCHRHVCGARQPTPGPPATAPPRPPWPGVTRRWPAARQSDSRARLRADDDRGDDGDGAGGALL